MQFSSFLWKEENGQTEKKVNIKHWRRTNLGKLQLKGELNNNNLREKKCTKHKNKILF